MSDIDDLNAKIKKVRKEAQEPEPETEVSNNAREGMQAASEFLGYVIAGIVLGYLADKYLGIQPLGIIFCPILGLITGVYRANQSMNKK